MIEKTMQLQFLDKLALYFLDPQNFLAQDFQGTYKPCFLVSKLIIKYSTKNTSPNIPFPSFLPLMKSSSFGGTFSCSCLFLTYSSIDVVDPDDY
jgi:hypothetical protein